LQDQYDRGMNLLTENKDVLDKIAQKLIDSESMTGIELFDLIYKEKPELIGSGQME